MIFNKYELSIKYNIKEYVIDKYTKKFIFDKNKEKREKEYKIMEEKHKERQKEYNEYLKNIYENNRRYKKKLERNKKRKEC